MSIKNFISKRAKRMDTPVDRILRYMSTLELDLIGELEENFIDLKDENYKFYQYKVDNKIRGEFIAYDLIKEKINDYKKYTYKFYNKADGLIYSFTYNTKENKPEFYKTGEINGIYNRYESDYNTFIKAFEKKLIDTFKSYLNAKGYKKELKEYNEFLKEWGFE